MPLILTPLKICNMEKYEFIKLMLQNRNLSVNDKKRLLVLATNEIERGDQTSQSSVLPVKDKGKDNKKETVHAPKDTASFLALFNYPDGFKFLTHEFDPDTDLDYDKLMTQVNDKFRETTTTLNIPTSLYAFIHSVIWGKDIKGKESSWLDFEDVKHSENYSCDEWKEWISNNPGRHLLRNSDFEKSIMRFRSSVRTIKSMPGIDSTLTTIIDKQAKEQPNLTVEKHGLENVDIYTYVKYLIDAIRRILKDMSKYAEKTPVVKITVDSTIDGNYNKKIIRITQLDSYSITPLDVVISKFSEGKGDFNGIKEDLLGYANWSVETLWNNIPMRWNILDDNKKPETEEIQNSEVTGFTHILTYYDKLKNE